METKSFKVVVLGSGGVGKTCVILRLTRSSFDPEYIPTIQDYFNKDMTIDGVDYTLKIIDTAGQDEMQGITDVAIKDADAVMIMYSITSQISFDEAGQFREKVLSIFPNKKINMVLVGNKCDLEPERSVSFSKGQELAQHWCCPFFETSAKKEINIYQSFESLLKMLISETKVDDDNQNAKEGKCCIIS
ncbi:ras-related protein Rap-1b isoform X1 [Histomonas meleagridis]|uniref:ras-related protein Rap-1b isoform X1 n=1 Tax=Histomonas meleagridis TaxID=135588 RepID=UPI00355ABBA1|nr:ras-related protein Rap-1b isoform X1 [Histomonas meleagridis]KAH0804780.1 ras-related protein Rap-1b isoform X1 [Histomonas meleagridis]